RQALLVLVRAGRLADEHQLGVGVARAEDDRRARGGELRAARAGRRLAPDRLELLAPLLRAGHSSNVSPAPAGSHTDPAVCATKLLVSAGISMRELARQTPPDPPACAIVGAGRLGTVMALGLGAAGPFGRGETLPAVDVVLLCVPDGQIA